jgi:hypothetical protein
VETTDQATAGKGAGDSFDDACARILSAGQGYHPIDPMRDGWRVEVSRYGEQVVAIEPRCLTGRDLSDEDEAVIRGCAAHLLSFVGEPRHGAIDAPLAERDPEAAFDEAYGAFSAGLPAAGEAPSLPDPGISSREIPTVNDAEIQTSPAPDEGPQSVIAEMLHEMTHERANADPS